MTVIIAILLDCFTECLVFSKEDLSTRNEAGEKKKKKNLQNKTELRKQKDEQPKMSEIRKYHDTNFHFLFLD